MSAVSDHGQYTLAQRCGDLIFSAGFTPRTDGRLVYVGTLGVDADENDANAAAELATSRLLTATLQEVPDGARLRVLHLGVFVRSAPAVSALSEVADSASRTICEQLGQGIPPARTTIGVAALPGGALVEVDMIAKIIT